MRFIEQDVAIKFSINRFGGLGLVRLGLFNNFLWGLINEISCVFLCCYIVNVWLR